MLVEPPDLAADAVLDVVRAHWDDGLVAAAFVPVGTGAHHWVAAGKRRPRWFVTADDVTKDGRLDELLDTYAAARELAARGHHLVVPTVPPGSAGDARPRAVMDAADARDPAELLDPADPADSADPADLVDPVDPADPVGVVLPGTWEGSVGGYLLTVTGYLEGESGAGDYVDDNQRALIAGALGALHAEPPPERARRWAPGPPRRDVWTTRLASLEQPWTAGPFAEQVRGALQDNAVGVGRLLARYDELAAGALERRDDWVPTHGEPHTGNVLWLAGGPVLVDWESLRVAPRERDLRTVLRGADGALPLSAYTAHGGSPDLDDDMVELFDLDWWLAEVAGLVERLAGLHAGDDDDGRDLAALLEELADLPTRSDGSPGRPVSKATAR